MPGFTPGGRITGSLPRDAPPAGLDGGPIGLGCEPGRVATGRGVAAGAATWSWWPQTPQNRAPGGSGV